MYKIRKLTKSDYDYYYNAFKSSHFRFYSNYNINELNNYLDNLVNREYENVKRYIVEHNKKVIGFFHLNWIDIDTIEGSSGLFGNFNSIYGVRLDTLAIYTTFYKVLAKQSKTTIKKDNLSAIKITKKLGAVITSENNNSYNLILQQCNLTDFFYKNLSKIKKEGLIYET